MLYFQNILIFITNILFRGVGVIERAIYWGGGGGAMTHFLMYHRKKLLRGEAQKGLMPDFFMRTTTTRRKIRRGGGGYTQIFGVYSKNITASVQVCWEGGGAIMPIFFMRTRKGGLYPNFWCVVKEYYCECGEEGSDARFFYV